MGLLTVPLLTMALLCLYHAPTHPAHPPTHPAHLPTHPTTYLPCPILPTLRPQVYKFGLYLRPVLGPVDLAWVGTTLALGFGCKLADYQAAPHPLPAASYALQTTRYPKPYP